MKSCILDPLPVTLLKQHFDLLLPIILKIVNLSLESGHFKSFLKTSVLSPLVKKADLDHEVLANYRAISNLKVISKIITKVVAVRLPKYLEAKRLNEPLQSTYKPFHSCETALVRVHNDICVAIDKRHCVMLLLLDLSAAFDSRFLYIKCIERSIDYISVSGALMFVLSTVSLSWNALELQTVS